MGGQTVNIATSGMLRSSSGSRLRPLDAVGSTAPARGGASPLRHSAKRCATSPAGGGKRTCVNPGKVCGKAKPQKSLSYHKVSLYLRACTWLSPRESWRDARKGGETERGASPACGGTNSDRCRWQKQGAVSGCEAEARPVDETAEAEQGQRSGFCKRAPSRAAKTG